MKSIDAKTAKEWIDKNEAIVIDVRQPEEYRVMIIRQKTKNLLGNAL